MSGTSEGERGEGERKRERGEKERKWLTLQTPPTHTRAYMHTMQQFEGLHYSGDKGGPLLGNGCQGDDTSHQVHTEKKFFLLRGSVEGGGAVL